MAIFRNILHKSTIWICVTLLLLACHQEITQPEAVLSKKYTAASESSFFNTVSGNTITIDSQYFSLKQSQDEQIRQFYAANGFKTKWLNEKAPGTLYYALTDLFNGAGDYGLRPTDYDLTQLDHHLNVAYLGQPVSQKTLIDLDIRISKMFFSFITDVATGKTIRTGYGRNVWKQPVKTVNPDPGFLAGITNSEALMAAVAKLEPAHEQYNKLKKALQFYKNLESAAADQPVIYTNDRIEPYQSNMAIPAVRRRLAITDSTLHATAGSQLVDSLHYDDTLIAAVKRFQESHGLEADGIIGEKTVRFLNQSFKEKADLIALNMERLRWTPNAFGDHYILVNIPEFLLRVYHGKKIDLEMKVITGAPDNATPIFNEDLEHIVFSPTWTVPPRILKEEVIPQLIKDPAFYAEKNYLFFKNETEIDPLAEVWDSEANLWQYKVVQLPGPNNSLGLVKFIMPNNMNVYLHDTPSRRLFKKTYRALSHGCIRLEKPALLAEYLLKDQGWDEEDVSKAMQSKDPSTVLLKKHYKVFIEYRTAWVDERGAVNFREDIYGHDRHQLRQLFPVKKRSAVIAGL